MVHITQFILHKVRQYCNKIGFSPGKGAPCILTSFPDLSMPNPRNLAVMYVTRQGDNRTRPTAKVETKKESVPTGLPTVAYNLPGW